jgi:predicted TIM-barrel enzyme
MSEGQSRRAFLGGLMLGGVSGALGALSQNKPGKPAPPKDDIAVPTSFVHPRQLLARVSARKKQLWVVSYVGQPVPGGKPLDGTFQDCEASLAGGADAVILINEYKDEKDKTQFPPLEELEAAVKAVRAKFPELKLGVNFLGRTDDDYGWEDSFRLARENGLSVVWTDDSGVDLIKEKPPVDLQKIKAAKPADVFYCSGIHMKYSTLLDEKKTIEESALQAMGWVDGIILTGIATGHAVDPLVVKRARRVIGDYPLGVASGTTPENVGAIRADIDFDIVHTGIQKDHRIQAERVKALRAALDG